MPPGHCTSLFTSDPTHRSSRQAPSWSLCTESERHLLIAAAAFWDGFLSWGPSVRSWRLHCVQSGPSPLPSVRGLNLKEQNYDKYIPNTSKNMRVSSRPGLAGKGLCTLTSAAVSNPVQFPGTVTLRPEGILPPELWGSVGCAPAALRGGAALWTGTAQSPCRILPEESRQAETPAPPRTVSQHGQVPVFGQ